MPPTPPLAVRPSPSFRTRPAIQPTLCGGGFAEWAGGGEDSRRRTATSLVKRAVDWPRGWQGGRVDRALRHLDSVPGRRASIPPCLSVARLGEIASVNKWTNLWTEAWERV